MHQFVALALLLSGTAVAGTLALTERFAPDTRPFDLEFTSVQFAPDGGGGYLAAARSISALPTSPELGDDLPFDEDDATIEITLDDGRTLPFLGVEYGSVWVNTDGSITLGAGDPTAPNNGLEDHFALPRISALLVDLNPRSGGVVRTAQFDDRLIVTWYSVSSLTHSGTSTAQAELHFNGRITLSWLGVAEPTSIVGVSEGGGLPTGFSDADLSALGSTGTTPFAFALPATTSPSECVTITLYAGIESPPHPVSFEIVSVPEHGSLYYGASEAPIEPSALPFALSGGGSAVIYRPDQDHRGADSFTYRASSTSGDDEAPVSIETDASVEAARWMLDSPTAPAGWTGLNPGRWEYGQPLGLGSPADPSAGFTGQHVFGYNLAGFYMNNIPPEHLVSPVIDVAGLHDVRLRFARWLTIAGSVGDGDNASIAISADDGETWTEVWHNPLSALGDSIWTPISMAIPESDNTTVARVRWTMGPMNAVVGAGGWNIDDIVVVGTPPDAPCPADTNGDRIADFADLNTALVQFGGVGPCLSADLDNSGSVGFEDLNAVLAAFGVPCD